MALPATDNFNRADAGTLGANWTKITSENDIGITSNRASNKSTGPINGDYWNADTFAGDQKSEAEVVKFGGGNDIELSVRVRVDNAAQNYYAGGRNDFINPNDRRRIWKITGGTRSSIAFQATALALNDVIRLEIVGTTLEIFYNGTSEFTGTDVSFASGSAGIGVRSAGGAAAVDDNQLDDWTGDDIAAVGPLAGLRTQALTGVGI